MNRGLVRGKDAAARMFRSWIPLEPFHRVASRVFSSSWTPVTMFLVLGVAAGLWRGPSWDEAIYLSQVSPDIPALPFAASRARGTSALVAPVVALTGSLPLVRLWMIGVNAALLALSIRRWRALIGTGAVVAGLLLATCWVVGFSGPEAMPNLPTALLGMLALGAWVTFIREGNPRYLAEASIAIGTMAFVRPLDALVFTASGLILSWLRGLGLPRERRFASMWALAAAWVVGALPWFVEVTVRSGSWRGIIDAAKTGHVGAEGLLERIRQYASLVDGPTLGPVARPEVGAISVFVLVVIAGAFVVGVWRSPGPSLPYAVRIPAVCSGALFALYLVLVGGIAPRFFLPAIAIAAIPAGVGLVEVARSPFRASRIAVAAFAVLFVVWNTSTLFSLSANAQRTRAVAAEIGGNVSRLARGRPCAVIATDLYPQIGFASRCRAVPSRGTTSDGYRAGEFRRQGLLPFFVGPAPVALELGRPARMIGPWAVVELR